MDHTTILIDSYFWGLTFEFFYGFLACLALGGAIFFFISLALTDKSERSFSVMITVAVLFVALYLIVSPFIHDFFLFSKVEIYNGKLWKLKNSWSYTLATIEPKDLKYIGDFTETVTYTGRYIGSSFDTYGICIATNLSHYHSVGADYRVIKSKVNQLNQCKK